MIMGYPEITLYTRVKKQRLRYPRRLTKACRPAACDDRPDALSSMARREVVIEGEGKQRLGHLGCPLGPRLVYQAPSFKLQAMTTYRPDGCIRGLKTLSVK